MAQSKETEAAWTSSPSNNRSEEEDSDANGKLPSTGYAQQHYIASGKSRKTLFLLSIGLKNTETDEPLFDIDVPPWTWIKRRSIKPSQAECCDEIKRRALVIQRRIPLSIVPHPKNWSWTKCVEWMTMYPVEDDKDIQFLRAEVSRAVSRVSDEEREVHMLNRNDPGSAKGHAFSGKRKRLADFLEMKEDDGDGRTQVIQSVTASIPDTSVDQAPSLQALTQAVGAFVAAYKDEGARQDRQATRRRIEELQDKSREFRRLFVEYPDKFSIVAKFYKSESDNMQAEVIVLKQSLQG